MKVGVYCGEKLWRWRSWRRYGLLRVIYGVGFSIGPVLIYKPQESE